MANEFRGLKQHSAEHFGDSRDHWWRLEQLAGATKEWEIPPTARVLDVGSGVGHWGRLLARVLPSGASFVGVDREALWVEKATERAAASGLGGRFEYRVGSAEALPFDAASFDVVTCQTVLMHVAEPERVVSEMMRVLRPGGLLLAAEPTNVLGGVMDAILLDDPPDVAADIFRFQLVCARGKKALGEGDDFIGERLPLMLSRAGLRGVTVRANDRAFAMLPPYETDYERAVVEEALDAAEREIWFRDRDGTRRFFLAGGGDAAELDSLWAAVVAQRRRTADALRAGTYTCSVGGGLFYLIWGRKPAE
jgi:SAM-dependent methyltransferase